MSEKNFTSHGHPIPGAPYRPDQQPRNVARCGGPGLCPDCSREATIALTAATPHLRAGMAEELLDDTPGSPLTRGYQRLMDPKPGDHPVRTWEAAVRVMLDTLLEGGGACCEHSKCPGGSICCCQEGGAE